MLQTLKANMNNKRCFREELMHPSVENTMGVFKWLNAIPRELCKLSASNSRGRGWCLFTK